MNHLKIKPWNKRSYYYKVKLRNTPNVNDRHAIRRRIDSRRKAFYKRETLRVLKMSGWSLPKAAEWLKTPRDELEGNSPKQALKMTVLYHNDFPKRAFYLLLKDLKWNITHTKVKPTPVTYDDNIE